MRHLYTGLLYVFSWLAPAFKWTSRKYAKWLSVRNQWEVDLKHFERKAGVPLVWFHCASVGEFEQARPVIDVLAAKQPVQIAVSFFSPSGYEAKKTFKHADVITYLPIDIPSRVNRFLDLLKPTVAVFVKYELWFNFMHMIHSRGIAMALMSAHFPHKHWSTQWPGIHLGIQLAQFDRVFAQTEVSCSRLQSVGIYNCVCVGDTRVDRVIDVAEKSFESVVLASYAKASKVLVVGSNWPEDDLHLIPVLKSLKHFNIIVAPHELSNDQKKRWLDAFKGEIQTLADFEEGQEETTRVVYVDQIGFLSKLYRFADVAYIGGGFGKAVHNTLEAAVYGIPVIFGPKNQRFVEIQALKEIGAGIEIMSGKELSEKLNKALDDQAYRDEVSSALKDFFTSHSGASKKVLKWIEEVVKS